MTNRDFTDPRPTEQRNPRTERIDVAAGTSGRLGVLDAAECPPTFGIPQAMVTGVIAGGYAALVKSAEGAEDDANAGATAMDNAAVTKRDVVVGIAASGTTPYVRVALARAQPLGARTVLVTCGSAPKVPPETSDVILNPGPEREAARARRADRDGVLRCEPGRGARRNRQGGGQYQARHRDGAARRERHGSSQVAGRRWCDGGTAQSTWWRFARSPTAAPSAGRSSTPWRAARRRISHFSTSPWVSDLPAPCSRCWLRRVCRPRTFRSSPHMGRPSGTSRAGRRCSSGMRRCSPSGSACGW